MAQTCLLIAPVQHILHRVPCSNKTLPNASKHYKMLQSMSLVPMGWIECVLCEKLRCDFVAQTCALVAPVQPVSDWVSCSNETLTNAPKHYENAPKHEFRVQWGGSVRSLPKIPMRVRGTNFCFNCTSSAYFASIFMQKWNNPKCTQTLQNAPIHEFSVQWGGSGAFIAKNSDAISWHELLH